MRGLRISIAGFLLVLMAFGTAEIWKVTIEEKQRSEPTGDLEAVITIADETIPLHLESALLSEDDYYKNLRCMATVSLISTEDGTEYDYGEARIYLQDLDEKHAARIYFHLDNQNNEEKVIQGMILKNGELYAEVTNWKLEPGDNPFTLDVTEVEGTGDCVYAFYSEGNLFSVVRIQVIDEVSIR